MADDEQGITVALMFPVPAPRGFLENLTPPDDEDGCWLWAGSTNSGGYGVYRGDLAHRLSWSYDHDRRPVPKGKMVLHSCDNPRCVNPRHLRVGDARDNFHDMRSRGREAPGWQKWANAKQRSRKRNARIAEVRKELHGSTDSYVEIPFTKLSEWIDALGWDDL